MQDGGVFRYKRRNQLQTNTQLALSTSAHAAEEATFTHMQARRAARVLGRQQLLELLAVRLLSKGGVVALC